MRSRPALLALNFFSADVQSGLGPYLGIYLLSVLQWQTGDIGIALAVASIATVLVQTPAGAIIDAVHWKRRLLAVCALVVGAATLAIPFTGVEAVIYVSQAAVGAAVAFVPPAIAAITLGLVGPAGYTQQTSANQAWNHAGNVTAAALIAVIGLYYSVEGVFWLVAVMAVLMVVSVAGIKRNEIDYEQARGGLEHENGGEVRASGFKTLLSDRRLVVFAISVVLFHFANAAMLPLVSQELSVGSDSKQGVAFASACIIAAQAVMLPMALLCGRKADVWGRKPLFILAFAILPIRGVLYTLWEEPAYLIAVQALDGVANGIFGVLFLLIVADLTHGTGRFNVAQGALTALVGVGAALSVLLAEQVVQLYSYDTGFLFLAGVALVGLVFFTFFMPETVKLAEKAAEEQTQRESLSSFPVDSPSGSGRDPRAG